MGNLVLGAVAVGAVGFAGAGAGAGAGTGGGGGGTYPVEVMITTWLPRSACELGWVPTT